MYKYKVVTLGNKRTWTKYEIEDPEEVMNIEAANGWHVFQVVPFMLNGTTMGLKVIFEKEYN